MPVNPALARRILVVALAFGVAYDLLFDRIAMGVNVPLIVLAALAAITLVRESGRRVDRLDAWIPPVTLLAAIGVARWTDPLLVQIDLGLAAVGTLAWALAVSVGSVTRRSVGVLAYLAATAGALVGLGSSAVLVAAARDRTAHRAAALLGRALPVIRGLLIAVPVVSLFVLLLGSADIAFRNLLEDVLDLPFDVDDVLRRGVVVVGATWVAAGVLLVATAGLPWGLADILADFPLTEARGPVVVAGDSGTAPARPATPALAQPERAAGPTRGVTETLTVLVAVEILFGAFVAVQVAYLFGGFATVAAFGITYSEYAREGFFQLVAVVVGAGILLTVAAVVASPSRWFAPAAAGLVALTAVILGSASLRLGLYQQAYGWTELRFYVAAAIVWLGLCLVIALAVSLTRRWRWLTHGLAFAAIAVAVVVTAIGPQSFITSENVARALNPSLVPAQGKDGLDVDYIATFGDGAVPILVDALPRFDDATRERVLAGLLRHRDWLDIDQASRPWPAWNLAREQARAALDRLPR
jgi:hypothetical protein